MCLVYADISVIFTHNINLNLILNLGEDPQLVSNDVKCFQRKTGLPQTEAHQKMSFMITQMLMHTHATNEAESGGASNKTSRPTSMSNSKLFL